MVAWRKSSYSGNGGSCVEVVWRKSTFSGDNGGCVEVAWPERGVWVRDSKNVSGPTVAFPEGAGAHCSLTCGGELLPPPRG
jgi:hypothetical protein